MNLWFVSADWHCGDDLVSRVIGVFDDYRLAMRAAEVMLTEGAVDWDDEIDLRAIGDRIFEGRITPQFDQSYQWVERYTIYAQKLNTLPFNGEVYPDSLKDFKSRLTHGAVKPD